MSKTDKICQPGDMFHVKQQLLKTEGDATMARRKTVKDLDQEIERLKRQVEIKKLKKELEKGGKK